MNIDKITELMVSIRLRLLTIEETAVEIQEIMDSICDELD